MSERMTLARCGELRRLHAVPEGRYSVEYADSTHLEEGTWVHIADLDIRPTPIPLADDGEQFYTLTPRIEGIPTPPEKGNADAVRRRADAARRSVADTLALALGRIGLLAPEVPPELLAELLRLEELDGVVIVPDTNALHNGAMHWLLRALRRPSVWLLPVVASLTTIQQRDATVKGLVNKRNISNLGTALRSRGLVNGALGLLQRHRGRYQVVEVDPSLLRYQKPASVSGSDPDQGDVLEDRLLIEAIHGVLRSMRSRTARRVVTSDVNMARVLDAEGIETLFVPTIVLQAGPIDCLRYDPLARAFLGAPLRALAWELAHAFGSIRIRAGDQVQSRLECHWPAKTPAEWASETLLCEFSANGAEPVAAPPGRLRAAEPAAPRPAAPSEGAVAAVAAAAERRGDGITAADEPEPPPAADSIPPAGTVGPAARRTAPTPATATALPRAVEITTPLPRASFPQVLRLLASVRRNGGALVERVVEGLGDRALTVENGRRGLEILRRARLVEFVDARVLPTPDAAMVDAALAEEDLDAVSLVMERFDAYQAFLEWLRRSGGVRRSDVIETVRGLLGPVGTYESERLPRFHILLGQAWTRGDMILDGSQRPTDRDAADAFAEAFAATAPTGIASVADLLPRFCEATRMSPWMAKRRIQKFVADRLLPEYTFQPAAGKKPVTRDEVVRGPLDRLAIEPVVVDRLQLGQRPVLTVEGPVR